MRDLNFLRNSNHSIQKLHKSHIDMLIPINLINLRHHCQIKLASNLGRSEVFGETLSASNTLGELG